jgi:K+-sensing histidine kinase KdpD
MAAQMRIGELLTRDRVALPVAVLTPLLVTVAVVPFRDDFANTNAALILVLVIVAVAAVGSRVAGLVAAVSAAVSFDLLLTQPYGKFTISDRTDLETAALLLAVGVGVTQLAVWGRGQHTLAQRDAGYLDGIRVAAQAVATGASSGDLIEEVSTQLTRMFGLRACRFEYGVAGLGQPARLLEDGRVEWHGSGWDVDRDGLPVDMDIELLAESAGRLQGRFLLTAAPGQHPSIAQRLVAVTLAAQAGASLR